MKNLLLNYMTVGCITISLVSCGGEEAKPPVPEMDSTEVAADGEDMWGFESMSGNYYQVPSPNELFILIKESKLQYKPNILGNEAEQFTGSKEQALNFGRMTADIAYTSSFSKYQESIENFDKLRKIGNDLGISYVFDEFMVNRVKNNMTNPDSLEMISANSYENIISQLEDNENGATLAIIAAGGFVESIYILVNLIGEYKADSPVIQRLADQKLVMENILDYLNLYSQQEKVQEVLVELEGVSDVFLNLDEVKVSPNKAMKDGKVVLGGSKILMNEDEFNRLKEEATAYRNSFANTNNS